MEETMEIKFIIDPIYGEIKNEDGKTYLLVPNIKGQKFLLVFSDKVEECYKVIEIYYDEKYQPKSAIVENKIYKLEETGIKR